MSEYGDLTGRVVDEKYRLGERVGSGGMGAVYRAIHLGLDRPVAVKLLASRLVSDEIARARFLREARAAARIEHPNAIRVYDFGTIDGDGAYLVMEYVDGVSLREVLKRRGRLPVHEAVSVAAEVAAALAAAHAHDVVHRDVKPENIMIGADRGGRATVKVVDFGIAKLLSADDETQLTRPAELIGTPRYMAPEIFAGDECDGRVDVYALGIVLYEMLAGRTPFEGTLAEVIGKHIYAEPASFASLGVDVPEAIDAVVRRALAKDPAARHRSAAELARDLLEACEGAIAPSAATIWGAEGSESRESDLTGVATGDSAPRVTDSWLGAAPTLAATTSSAPVARRRYEIPSIERLARAVTLTRDVVERSLFWPRRRYAAAAAASALAGAMIFGQAVVTPEETAEAAPVRVEAAPARVEAAPVAPADADVATLRLDVDEGASAPESDAEQSSTASPLATVERESEPEREKAGDAAPSKSRVDRESSRRTRVVRRDVRAERPRANPLGAIGRAVRVDQHLKRLF